MLIAIYKLTNPIEDISKAIIQDCGSLAYLFVYRAGSKIPEEIVYRTANAAKTGYCKHYQNPENKDFKPKWEISKV